MNQVFDVLGPIIVIFFIAWTVRGFIQYRQAKAAIDRRAELQNRLLDKFDTAENLQVFLQSDSGAKFLESATLEKGNPFGRILGSVQAGLILLVGGAAFYAQRNVVEGAYEGFSFIGTLGMALGIGFLLSAVASYRLSQKWGLLDQRPPVD
ncbi:MAG: hypothetical protein AAF604_17770 [Acidobacteriota bacterium]